MRFPSQSKICWTRVSFLTSSWGTSKFQLQDLTSDTSRSRATATASQVRLPVPAPAPVPLTIPQTSIECTVTITSLTASQQQTEMSSHSGRRSQMGGVKYKYAVTATSLLIVLLAGCSYSEAFLLSDRSISISISISNGRHRLHRRRHGLSQSLLLSLRAVAKDKKLKNDNKLKDKTEIETPESSGYHLGVFPYLSTPSQATSASASSNGTSTSTLSVDPQQRSTGMNATNSNSTKTTNVDVDVDSETVTEKALNLNSTTAKEDFNTTSKTDALFFTQKSSTSIIKRASTSASTLVVDRPELSKSSTNTATTANTATAVNTTGKSNSQDSKVEESWQDKYLNRFRYDKSKSKGTTASTRTSKKPSTSLVSKMQANVNVKGALGKERKESTPLMAGRNPSDPLTVQDLESFLMTSGFVRRSELEESQKAQQARSSANDLPGNGVGSSVGSATQKTVSGVALPSPSVISYENVKWGAAVSAGFLGMLIGLSILPNLWLMGTLAGFLYGWEIGKKLPETLPTTRNALNNMIVNLGRNLAKGCLTVYDAANAIFFMYKTGELSYSYYKRFSVLDKRFKIQNKVDAWNARFVEGKADFEKWEQQNEVGRKALAVRITCYHI
jgi:hypothetical protein